MGAPACLVTASPEFEETEQSRPILLPETAAPDLRSVLDIEKTTTQSQTIEAQLAQSEDKGQPIQVRLYVDYGVPLGNLIGQQVFFGTDVTPFDASQPVRIAQADINPVQLDLGCHTATLIAAHEFDNPSGCPKRLADSSQLTWQILVREGESCSESTPPPAGEGCFCAPKDPAALEALVACPDIADNFDPSAVAEDSP
jgi:hypothetical protein